jgi:transcriptional regulator with XRE-family HTH domain
MRNQQDILKQIGLKIRGIRKNAGITQEELAYQSGLDRSYVGDIERGERNFGIMCLFKIASTLNCPLEKILNNDYNE